MKNKRIVISLIVFLLIALFSINVYAEDEDPTPPTSSEWTDLSGIKMEIQDVKDILGNKEQKLRISNIPTDKLKSTSAYHVIISNIANSEVKYNSETETFEGEVYILNNDKAEEEIDNKISSYVEKNGDIYVSIIEYRTETKDYKKIIADQKMVRPALNPLGQRILATFYDDATIMYFKESMDAESARKVNLKIGTITDSDILVSIKNGETNCLQKLIDYAKSAQSIYTATVPVGKSDSITSNMNLVDGAYYYVYMEMEDENGKYYPVEDVSLYQAIVNDMTGKNLFNYLDDNFKWNLDESKVNPSDSSNTKKDTTLANTILPKTGIATIIGIVTAILIINVIIVKYKCNKYRDVK